MKRVIILLAVVTIVPSCKEDLGYIGQGDAEYGAFMNVVSVDTGQFSTLPGTVDLDTTNEFVITLEARDGQQGGLLESYDFYLTHKDIYSVNGTKPDTLLFLKSVPASAFVTHPVTGYPRATISITAIEILTTLGYGNTSVNGGDYIDLAEVLVLTDGREFTGSNSTIMTGGTFFSSPYFHRIPVICLSDLSGTFSTSTTEIVAGPGGDSTACPTPLPYTITLTAIAGQLNKYAISDASFGQYACAWGDNDASGVFLNVACGKLYYSSPDQYGLLYFLTFGSNDGTNLTINWYNDYGDSGLTVITSPTPGFWPTNLN